ncbi:MAG: hypothetical protein R2803_09435 [Rhodococcus zopfii]
MRPDDTGERPHPRGQVEILDQQRPLLERRDRVRTRRPAPLPAAAEHQRLPQHHPRAALQHQLRAASDICAVRHHERQPVPHQRRARTQPRPHRPARRPPRRVVGDSARGLDDLEPRPGAHLEVDHDVVAAEQQRPGRDQRDPRAVRVTALHPRAERTRHEPAPGPAARALYGDRRRCARRGHCGVDACPCP